MSTMPDTSDHGRPRLVKIEADGGNEEIRDPVAKKPRIEGENTVAQAIARYNSLVAAHNSRLNEIYKNANLPPIDETCGLLSSSPPAPIVLEIPEAGYKYSAVLKSFHDLTLVMEDPVFEDFREKIIKEIEKPETASMKIREGELKISLLQISFAATHFAKSDQDDKSVGLKEFMRLFRLQLINLGFQKENSFLTTITEIINVTSRRKVISEPAVKTAMETLLVKTHQGFHAASHATTPPFNSSTTANVMDPSNVYEITVKNAKGEDTSIKIYQGKVVYQSCSSIITVDVCGQKKP